MRILIADDDAVSRMVLQAALRSWGHEVAVVNDGDAAWEHLRGDDPAPIAILDWIMPGIVGPELCRRARELSRAVPSYLILLTARGATSDVVVGLDSGADDYITKPFDPAELRSRLKVGERIIGLQARLAERVRELETALGQVKQLKGLLPICSYCKKVRGDSDYWLKVESYVAAHTEARFTHGVCPTCWEEVVVPELAAQGVVAAYPG